MAQSVNCYRYEIMDRLIIIHTYIIPVLFYQTLIRFVQGGVGGGYMRKLLAEKQQWCHRTISLLDKLDPGMSLSRGSSDLRKNVLIW